MSFKNKIKRSIQNLVESSSAGLCDPEERKSAEAWEGEPDWPPAALDREGERGGERGHRAAQNIPRAGMFFTNFYTILVIATNYFM